MTTSADDRLVRASALARLRARVALWIVRRFVFPDVARNGLGILPAVAERILRDIPTAAERALFVQLFLRDHMRSEDRVRIARETLLLDLPESERAQVPSMLPRDRPMHNTWTYQNEAMRWDIAPGDRVLDVGSGGWPFRLATHLADRYPAGTTHRVEALARDERPFAVVDIHRLPYADKAFDFVFCSHVLEHLDRPGDAIRELTRVGRRGYIETPTRLSDVMLDFTGLPEHHRWHTLLLGKTLVFLEWQDAERRDTGVKDFFLLLHSRYRNPFQDLFERNWGLFFSQLRWEDSVDFKVIDKQGRVVDQACAAEKLR